MKSINKIALVVTKILEIAHWVAVGLMAAAGICAAAAPQWLGYFMDVKSLKTDGEMDVYGFEVTAAAPAGEPDMTTIALFAVGAVIIFVLIAMIFRNINLIIKKSENDTPFRTDNIRRLKEIGVFSIAVPVVGLIMSTVIRLVVGVDAAEMSLNLDGFVMGIIVLCLTQFFAHGAELEKDVEGLL